MHEKTVRHIVVDLAISPEELLKLYRGVAKDVVTRSIQGLTVRFPAISLQPFVTRSGVHGRFRLEIDNDNRLLNVQQLR